MVDAFIADKPSIAASRLFPVIPILFIATNNNKQEHFNNQFSFPISTAHKSVIV